MSALRASALAIVLPLDSWSPQRPDAARYSYELLDGSVHPLGSSVTVRRTEKAHRPVKPVVSTSNGQHLESEAVLREAACRMAPGSGAMENRLGDPRHNHV